MPLTRGATALHLGCFKSHLTPFLRVPDRALGAMFLVERRCAAHLLQPAAAVCVAAPTRSAVETDHSVVRLKLHCVLQRGVSYPLTVNIQ